MNKWGVLTKSVLRDLPTMKRPLLLYSLVYLGSAILSGFAYKLPADDTSNLPALLTRIFFINTILLIQSVNAIYFQRSYTNATIVGRRFTSIIKVLFHTFRIFILQMLILLPVAILCLILITPFVILGFDVLKLLPFIMIPFFALIIFWMARLIFVGMIIVYQRDKIKMKEIIAESKLLVRHNLSVVLPILALQYIPIIYMTLNNIVTRKNFSYPLSYSTFATAANFLFSLIYLKIVIEKHAHEAQESQLQIVIASA